MKKLLRKIKNAFNNLLIALHLKKKPVSSGSVARTNKNR